MIADVKQGFPYKMRSVTFKRMGLLLKSEISQVQIKPSIAYSATSPER
jgi:hypothetical protein